MKRAVLYARHSDKKQNESSTADQLALCRRYCAEQGIEVVREFYDEARSGLTTVSRSGFDQLVQFVDHRTCDFVICEDLSRISRDLADLAIFYRRLKFLGLDLLSINEGLTSDMAIGFKGTMNSIMLDNLKKMTKRGMISSVLKGKVPGGPKYGYERILMRNAQGKIEKGLLKIKEDEAAIVQWIFDEYVKNGGAAQPIVDELNARGIPTIRRGKIWYHHVISGNRIRTQGLLRNTIYKGVITFGRTENKTNPETGRRIVFATTPDQWITVDVPELQIVPTDIFEEAQKILAFKMQNGIKPSSKIKISDRQKVNYIKQHNQGNFVKETGRQKRIILFSERTFCKWHKDKIKAIRAGRYSCPRKGCRSKALDYLETTRAVLLSMQKLTVEEMEQYENRMATVAEAEQEKIRQLNEKIQPITDKLKEIYMNQSGKPGQALVELVNQLERDRDDLLWHLKNNQNSLKIYHCTTAKKRARTLEKFKNGVQKVRDHPNDMQSLIKMKKCLARADLETVGGNIYCTTTINFEGLYTIYNA